jgi:poly(3-hydroxybutyrate) depolymerase
MKKSLAVLMCCVSRAATPRGAIMPTATRRPQGKPLFTIPNCANRYISAMQRLRFVRYAMLYAVLATCSCGVHAAQTVSLPGWVCSQPDAIFVSEFDTAEAPVPHDPSLGSGGATGTTAYTLHIAGLGTGKQTYYLYVPTSYTPSQAYAFVLALHGTAPYASRNTYASDVLNAWSTIAATGRFIVATPVADEEVSVDGQPGATWSVPPDSPSDYDLFAAVLTDVESHYNIDRTRISGWGFSSGGSVMHALGLTNDSSAFNNDTMAGYSAAAGALAGLVCAGVSNTQCDQIVDAAPRKIPISLVVGTSDPTDSYVVSDYGRFKNDGWTASINVFFDTFSGGHDYSTSDIQLAWTHLCPNAVTP